MTSLHILSSLIILCAYGFLGSTAITFPYTHPSFTYTGRNYHDESGLRYDWPCSSI